MKSIVLTLINFLMAIILFSSCATTKLSPDNKNNDAKNIVSLDDKALVYIYRKPRFGITPTFRIDCNNIELTKLNSGEFYLSALEPGKYLFAGHAENEDEIIVNVEKGKKYFIRSILQMGLIIGRCKLELVDQETGNSDIQKCDLIGLNNSARKIVNYSQPEENAKTKNTDDIYFNPKDR